MRDCILTLEDGAILDLRNPDPDLLIIDRIALYLSRIPRWLGHFDYWWSVADHSIWVADRLPKRLKLQGLLHDAPEAFIGDLPSPMKAQLKVYRTWEALLWKAIAARYGVPVELDPIVKRIDELALRIENRDIRPRVREKFSGAELAPLPRRTPENSEALFKLTYAKCIDNTPANVAGCADQPDIGSGEPEMRHGYREAEGNH